MRTLTSPQAWPQRRQAEGAGNLSQEEGVMANRRQARAKAGFKAYQSNNTTPKTQALIGALASGEISTFKADGTVYHAYPDKVSNTLYVGTQADYAKYLSLAQGQKVCRRVEAPNSAGFWSCMNEFHKAGGLPK
jgi:hypothetical protein